MDLKFYIYKAILSVLCEPTYLHIIGGVVIGIAIGMIKWLKNLLRVASGKIYTLCGGDVGGDRDRHVMTEEDVKMYTEIFTMLENLLTTLDCTRVSVLQYHNGDNFSLSNPMFKLSVTYEAIANGIAPTVKELSDISVSTIPSFFQPLFLPDSHIPGVKEEKFCSKADGCQLRELPFKLISYTQNKLKLGPVRLTMERFGVEKMYACSLITPTGALIGALVIHYRESEGADASVKKHICEICKTQQYLQTILYRK